MFVEDSIHKIDIELDRKPGTVWDFLDGIQDKAWEEITLIDKY